MLEANPHFVSEEFYHNYSDGEPKLANEAKVPETCRCSILGVQSFIFP
jgi:hypothetical protein